MAKKKRGNVKNSLLELASFLSVLNVTQYAFHLTSSQWLLYLTNAQRHCCCVHQQLIT